MQCPRRLWISAISAIVESQRNRLLVFRGVARHMVHAFVREGTANCCTGVIVRDAPTTWSMATKLKSSAHWAQAETVSRCTWLPPFQTKHFLEEVGPEDIASLDCTHASCTDSGGEPSPGMRLGPCLIERQTRQAKVAQRRARTRRSDRPQCHRRGRRRAVRPETAKPAMLPASHRPPSSPPSAACSIFSTL